MKTLTQYREDIAKLMKKAADIEAKCTAENRNPNDPEVALTNEIIDEVENLRGIVSAMERRDKVRVELEKPGVAMTVQKIVEQPQKDKFGTLGEQLICVKQAMLPGGQVDPRLHNIR